jgi:hypothetical protein
MATLDASDLQSVRDSIRIINRITSYKKYIVDDPAEMNTNGASICADLRIYVADIEYALYNIEIGNCEESATRMLNMMTDIKSMSDGYTKVKWELEVQRILCDTLNTCGDITAINSMLKIFIKWVNAKISKLAAIIPNNAFEIGELKRQSAISQIYFSIARYESTIDTTNADHMQALNHMRECLRYDHFDGYAFEKIALNRIGHMDSIMVKSAA